MGTSDPEGVGSELDRGTEGRCISRVERRVFSPKRPKIDRVNSVFMHFSVTIFPGRVPDFFHYYFPTINYLVIYLIIK